MADVKVNDKQWNDLSADSRDQITRILSASGLLKKGDVIKASPGVAVPRNNKWPWCDVACDVAAAAAGAACALISDGVAAAACYAAASAADAYCHSQC
jgi:hypothetical protein